MELSFSLSPAPSAGRFKEEEYDVVIVGGGPAGLSAAIYASRFLLKTAVISKDFGGQILDAHLIENYPGFPSITGEELAGRFQEHARKFGAELVKGEVEDIEREGEWFVVVSTAGTVRAKTVILATGSRRKKLNVPGEARLAGKGVSYCAVCDAAFFRGQTVAIVGGGNTALTDALYLTQYVKKLYLIHRRREFRGEPIYLEQLKKKENVEILTPYAVEEVLGEERVEGVRIRNVETGEERVLEVSGLFVAIGMLPGSEIARNLGAEVTESGHVVVGEDMSTSVPGLFAAGDLTTGMNHVHQIVTAAAGGAIAAISAFNYIKNKFKGRT